MKLNNKGLSVVEFIIVFVILMIIVFGMMNVVLTLKKESSSISMKKELLEFKTTMTKEINQDLIEKGYDKVENCTTGISCDIYFKDNSSTTLIININQKTITYDGIIYDIPQKDFIKMENSTINIDEKFLTISIPYYEMGVSEENKVDYGIKIIYPISL